MPKKVLIIAMFGFLAIGGSVYYSLHTTRTITREAVSTISEPAQKEISTTVSSASYTKEAEEPKLNAPNETLIDYIADGLYQNETDNLTALLMQATGTIINEEPVIGINF
jgi:hypothetical protein